MRKFVLAVVFLALMAVVFRSGVILGGFGYDELSDRLSNERKVSASLRNDLDQARQEIGQLQKEVQERVMFESEIAGSDSKLMLGILDAQLKSLEDGYRVLSRGSFTDYFVPALEDARRRGASATEVNRRLDRVLVLAKNGKYLSSYVRAAHEDGTLEQYIMKLKEGFLASVQQ